MNLGFHIVPRNTHSAFGTGRQQWQGHCPVEAGVTYHDLGNAVFSGLCRFALYFPSTVYAPLIALGPLMVAYCTPLHLLAHIL